jgi:hypothetical protein
MGGLIETHSVQPFMFSAGYLCRTQILKKSTCSYRNNKLLAISPALSIFKFLFFTYSRRLPPGNRMNWLKAAISSSSQINIDRKVDECSGCAIPCSDHPNYPGSLIDKIDQGNLHDSVKAHRRHLCIAQGIEANKWPNDINDSKDGYAEFLGAKLKLLKTELGYSVKLTATDELCYDEENRLVEPADREELADWYIFPDQIKVKHVRREQVDDLLNILFIQDKSTQQFRGQNNHPSATPLNSDQTKENFLESLKSYQHEKLTGLWLLICAHKLRDKRCGVSGPILAAEAQKYAQEKSLNELHTLKISHVGGHKWAGNVIVYPPGVWYGRVTPCHIPTIIHAHSNDDNSNNNSNASKPISTQLQEKLKPLLRGSVQTQW